MMKYFYLILSLLLTFAVALPAVAQISIDEVKAPQDSVAFKDRLKFIPVETEYFNMARYKAERAAIRKERNYLELGGGLLGSLTSFNDSWIAVSGGDNSIALVGNLFLRHVFSKNLFSVETKFDATFGYNRMKVETQRIGDDGKPMVDESGEKVLDSEGVWYKNQDQFAISVAPAFKMSKNWSYGAIFKFRTQFANGYVSRTQQEQTNRKSTFMAPGYFDASFGITYKCPKPKFPIVINLSPIALSGVFVESKEIRNNQWDKKYGWQTYGLADPDKTSKYEGGSSVQIDFDRSFGKSGFLRYRTTLYSFSGWITNLGQKRQINDYTEYRHAMDSWKTDGSDPKTMPQLPIHPTVRWENRIDIKATKYLSTTFAFQLYYNRAQNTEVQTQMQLSVGLTYTFKNK